MTEVHIGKGSCLCGAVNFTAKSNSNRVAVCHCKLCQKWSGGPFFEIECGESVSFTGNESIAIYKSSEWAERAFCKVCGTHLFIRVLADNEFGLLEGISIPPGLFDEPSEFHLTYQLFSDHKPDYYRFLNLTLDFTSDDVYGKFPKIRNKKS